MGRAMASTIGLGSQGRPPRIKGDRDPFTGRVGEGIAATAAHAGDSPAIREQP